MQIRHPTVEQPHPNTTKGKLTRIVGCWQASFHIFGFSSCRRHSISTTVPTAEKSSPHENNNVPVAMKTEEFAEVEKKRNVDLVDAESNTVLTGMEKHSLIYSG